MWVPERLVRTVQSPENTKELQPDGSLNPQRDLLDPVLNSRDERSNDVDGVDHSPADREESQEY